MVANIENFEKFIIKQIVNTVDYHPESDEFEFNRICISDELINIIGNEGARYGIEKGKSDKSFPVLRGTSEPILSLI